MARTVCNWNEKSASAGLAPSEVLCAAVEHATEGVTDFQFISTVVPAVFACVGAVNLFQTGTERLGIILEDVSYGVRLIFGAL